MIQKEDIKIHVLDDEIIIIRDIEDILDSMGLNEVSSALTLQESKEQIAATSPDLIICDINLKDDQMNGVQFMETIQNQFKQVEVLYVSAYSNPEIVSSTKSTNPLNYIVKPFDEKQLIVAVNIAVDNILKKKETQVDISMLTSTEKKILGYIRDNHTTKEIAVELFVSEKTIKNHRYNICKKLELENKANSLLTWVLENKSKIPF